MEFKAEQIAGFLQGDIVGDAQASVHTFSKIEEGVPGAISFLANEHYEHYLYETKSTIVLVNRGFQPKNAVSATLIYVDNAYEAVAKLLSMYEQSRPKRTGIDSLACIDKTAKVGENCYIGPFVYVGPNATVGDNCRIYAHSVLEEGVKLGNDCLIYPNVSIYHDCVLGNRVTLHSGCVIGADGFGFAPTADGYEKIPQIGIVTLEDDVEIGANSCVDRSTMGSTYVRKGVKLDNMVQIAHNCDIGSNTVMSAQVGVAGSTKIGQWCMFGGQTGVAGHITVGDKVYCGAQSGISGLWKKGHATIMGSPAFDSKVYFRAHAALKNLPDMYRDFYLMKSELEELKKKLKE